MAPVPPDHLEQGKAPEHPTKQTEGRQEELMAQSRSWALLSSSGTAGRKDALDGGEPPCWQREGFYRGPAPRFLLGFLGHPTAIPHRAAGSGLPDSRTGGRWRWFSCWTSGQDSLEEREASCQPKVEKGPSPPPSPEKPTMVLGQGCFGEGEVLLCVTAPGTFPSSYHFNRGTSLCCLLPWPASPTTSRCSAWGSRWRKRSSRLYLESKIHELEVKLD
ncbi:uncharacterized protein LOC142093588 isoform X2 [Calonectris borealis]|uniref:uncharacterized protein LOC142093588 isoform X2 n=1 Tax=Calonectris borealis TaxID=1323832 RepID=UPI003F4B0E7E